MNGALAFYVTELILGHLIFLGRVEFICQQGKDHLWQQTFQFSQVSFKLELLKVGILKSLRFEADGEDHRPVRQLLKFRIREFWLVNQHQCCPTQVPVHSA